ncbi:MAG: helix-turn-helix transcriptional regulator [Thermodesulfovibrionia bacterium]|nr:helix-turn-helix transcriptional regulator [Thermodesulfovibrionia bacterium]
MGKSLYSKEYEFVLEQLKSARIEAGLTQKDVAERFGKPQSYISKCESGERRLDVVELNKFAKLYKKSLSFFIK